MTTPKKHRLNGNVSPQLVKAFHKLLKARGQTFSDWLRQQVRTELDQAK